MRIHGLVALLVTALFLVPGATAQTDSSFQSTSGDPQYLEEGKECLEAVGFSADIGPLPGAPTCTVLYGHLFDIISAVPINVQRPPSGQLDLARGITGEPVAEQAGFNKNQLTLYSSPGFVEYQSPTDDDPRLHPERGITDDVKIDKAIPITGYWYMSADAEEVSTFGGDHADGVDVGAMPCLTVRMVLQTGRVYGTGQTLAEGSITKTIISDGVTDTQESTGQTMDCSTIKGGQAEIMSPNQVTEFKVDLGTASSDIPKINAFHVFVEWYQWAPSSPDSKDKVGQREWNIHSGPSYPNRVVIPLENPVRIEEVRPQPFAGKIYIHGVYNSPWGSYDVDPGTMTLKIFDASGKEVSNPTVSEPTLHFSVDHDGHFKPVNATFAWDYLKDDLVAGEYTIELGVQNWQHTGAAVASGKIKIGANAQDVEAFDNKGNLQKNQNSLMTAEESPLSPMTLIALLAAVAIGLARLRRD